MTTLALLLAVTRVGIIGLDTSHSIAFTKIMNVDKDPGVAGFQMVAAYQWGSKDIVSSTNRYPKYLAEMKEMGVEIVPSIEDLLAKVDCVCLETNDGREHLWQAEKECLEVMAFMEAAEMSAKRGGEPVTLAEAIDACTDASWWKFW